MPRRGSSPRMRGTPYGARAAFKSSVAHPHVCGEHFKAPLLVVPEVGSSPRMRGTLTKTGLRADGIGLIPTYAGNTRRIQERNYVSRAHPHVCGEHDKTLRNKRGVQGSSPRMRGTHLLTWGFIPTHQVLELVWSPKPVLTLHDFRAYRRREARLYLLALLHPFRGPRSSFGADGRIISFTPSKSTGSHG